LITLELMTTIYSSAKEALSEKLFDGAVIAVGVLASVETHSI